MQRGIGIKGFINTIIERVYRHKISVHAAQATLFIIISVLPFAMLLISIIKYLIPFSRADVMTFATAVLPTNFLPIINTLTIEIFGGATVPVVSVATFATIWSASKGILSLVQGLESVNETEKERGYFKTRIFSLIYTVVFVIILSATFLVFVAGRYFVNLAISNFPALSPVGDFINSFPVVYFVILTFVFALLYKILPCNGFNFINQVPGAVFSATGWVCFSAGYSFYVNRFANYSYIYGSLTAVVLLILWLYFCMNIFLFGAEINCLLKERKEKHIEG